MNIQATTKRKFAIPTNMSHHLMISRKRSRLTQTDISFLLNLKDPSTICRWETGERDAPLRLTLLYHVLFGSPLLDHINSQKEEMEQELKERIPQLLELLQESSEPNTRLIKRMQFLEIALLNL